MTSDTERFRQFVKDSNDAAPFETLLHAVQGKELSPDDDAVERAQVSLSDDLGNWLSNVGIPEVDALPDEAKVQLRELLSEGFALRLVASTRASFMLDLVTTGRVTDAQIDQLFRGYDIDLKNPEALAYVDGVFREAAGFFDDYVVSGDGDIRRVPASLRNLSRRPDVRLIYRIFQTAAGTEGQRMHIPFACALLRIAFVIDHAKTHPRIQAVNEVHAALEHRFSSHLTLLEGGRSIFRTRSGDPGILLAGFALRPKSASSIYAKLLHKPETNVGSIHDLLACSFKTHTPQDTLRLIYALFFDPDDAVFSPYLIDPRNSDQLMFDQELLRQALVDPQAARALVERMADRIPSVDMPHAATNLFASSEVTQTHRSNPHSSRYFRILKAVTYFRVMRGQGRTDRKNGTSRKLHRVRHGVDFPLAPAVAVPIECQFGDLETLTFNQAVAPHFEYKDRQREEVRARLMRGNLMEAYRQWLLSVPILARVF